jgi:hypothetical protein
VFVKLYRYHIQPAQVQRFQLLQQADDRVYQRYVDYVVLLQSQSEPGTWLEIHWHPDEANYNQVMLQIQHEPEINRLWQEFQSLLDPAHREIEEESYHQVLELGS